MPQLGLGCGATPPSQPKDRQEREALEDRPDPSVLTGPHRTRNKVVCADGAWGMRERALYQVVVSIHGSWSVAVRLLLAAVGRFHKLIGKGSVWIELVAQ